MLAIALPVLQCNGAWQVCTASPQRLKSGEALFSRSARSHRWADSLSTWPRLVFCVSRRPPRSLAHIRPRVSAYAASGPWFHTRSPGDSGPGGAESEGALHFRSPYCARSDDKRVRRLRRGGDDFIAAVGAGESGPALRYAVRAVFAAGGAADASEDRFIPVLVASAGVLPTGCQPFFPRRGRPSCVPVYWPPANVCLIARLSGRWLGRPLWTVRRRRV